MLRITATKRDGRLVFHRVDEYQAWIRSQENGQTFRIEVKPLRATKTLQQLAYYYGVVIPSVIEWMKDQGWSELGFIKILNTRVPLAIDVDNTDSYLKVLYATSRGIEYEVKKARMTKHQMIDFLNFILAWAFENGICIPTPEHEEQTV
jgi:hypothetical protein